MEKMSRYFEEGKRQGRGPWWQFMPAGNSVIRQLLESQARDKFDTKAPEKSILAFGKYMKRIVIESSRNCCREKTVFPTLSARLTYFRGHNMPLRTRLYGLAKNISVIGWASMLGGIGTPRA
jgi:hypothetical protein